MSRPSDPLLRWLRGMIKERRHTAASLAQATGLRRPHLRKVLTGGEPMTVDELLAVVEALGLSAEDMLGLAAKDLPEQSVPAAPGSEAEQHTEELPLDPWGNQPEQLFRVGFALGCDFLFLARTDQLDGSGVPTKVLDNFRGRELPIRLDAAYHVHNDPRYDEGGVTLTLSFDALYECRFPWPSIQQVVFFPAPVEPPPEISDEEDSPPSPPHLRLVE